MSTRTQDEDDLCFTPAVDLVTMIRRRELSPVELMETILRRIDRVNPSINAFVTLIADEALAQAAAAEAELMRTPVDKLLPLHGMPMTVKDLTPTKGVRTTYGSKHHASNVPTEDGAMWARLKAAGAILIGKTTTPEFGFHSITESPLTGTTNNPWDVTRTTGGSSGGAAAAIAAGFGPLATGSDGGGSIRVPSSYCGVVGLKSSIGRIPRVPESSPFDSVLVVGPMTRTVLDNALMLSVVAGPHPGEPFSILESGIDYVELARTSSLREMSIGFSTDLGNPPVQDAVEQGIRQAAAVFANDLGARVEEIAISLPDPFQYYLDWWGPIIAAEFDHLLPPGADLADSHHQVVSFVAEAQTGTGVDLARTALYQRAEIHEAFRRQFEKHDLLIWPSTATTAYEHPGPAGGPLVVAGKKVRDPAFDNQRLTEAIAHAGYPAISVPCGFDESGMPIGLQIAGRHGADATVLMAAHAFEQARPWAHRRPNLESRDVD